MASEQKIKIVLQARTSSTRLPAKVFLPLKDIPLGVMCSKRLNKGKYDFVLATSTDPSDDLLCKICKKNDIQFYRGDLKNVQKRFVECSKDLSSEDLIVRLTADNPFPDEGFVEKLIELFKLSSLEYLGTNSPKDGLPYGLSGEVFTVGLLREFYKKPLNDYDKEHVTSTMRSVFSKGLLSPRDIIEEDLSYLRCTVDTFDDYLKMANLFHDIDNPEVISWFDLIQELKRRV